MLGIFIPPPKSGKPIPKSGGKIGCTGNSGKGCTGIGVSVNSKPLGAEPV